MKLDVVAKIVRNTNTKNAVLIDSTTVIDGRKGHQIMTAAAAMAAGLAIITIAGSKWAVLA